jgi:diguanylate cyclase (GGDEF)-like protein/PAS domain S-box-containing protein
MKANRSVQAVPPVPGPSDIAGTQANQLAADLPGRVQAGLASLVRRWRHDEPSSVPLAPLAAAATGIEPVEPVEPLEPTEPTESLESVEPKATHETKHETHQPIETANPLETTSVLMDSTTLGDDDEHRLDETTVSAIDFLAHVDQNLQFVYVSDASLSFIGYQRDYLRTIGLADLLPPNEVQRLDRLAEQVRATGLMQKCIMHLVKSLTYPTCVELRLAPAVRKGVNGFAVAAFDVSAWRETEERLNYQLNHDVLTGLENQNAAESAIAAAQAEAVRLNRPLALLLLDLDGYERINRGLGYDAGDQFLRETARRLRENMRAGDRLARCGSDRFCILASDAAGPIEVERLSRRLLATIQQPYGYQGQAVHMSASIGVSSFSQPRRQSGNLLHQATLALARAKRAGGNTLAFYSADADPLGADTIKLEADLHDGVRNGEFSLNYQPITDCLSGEVVGVEALMRWKHPILGMMPPVTFIPLAESSGLINFLGNWALRIACMQLKQWDAIGLHLGYVAVNVSPRQFRDARFVTSVREALELTGIEPARVVLEITEGVLMHDPAKAKLLLEELVDLGVRCAVDDFGTGYSSLAYLQRFPLATLKIDRSFIENLLSSRNDRAIVTAVVGLARNLNLQLVAEGVETEAQRALLVEMGCSHMQGWLVSQAMPADGLAARFERGELRALDGAANDFANDLVTMQ